ncbi:mercuric resistance operon regulatory protein [Mariprofundus micogutta]|uniref:Mercuric resistance operon regulatory protein n=1 Tax=Mariprofundus micogutta TaxID=1921010 RepID=A0A1L8CKL6_9PROT|nr:heavy metal-responsive transcriptional regulator [Mariprofundus micogutta]GAV19441.1 mercuric resistance operon regulatory protein [Mariprofundus micogutta]
MKIGELSKLTKVNIDTIRYYERRQLLPLPKRTMSGYRDYSESDVKRLLFVIHAKELGFTLEEIRELLSLRAGQADCSQVKMIAEIKASKIASRIESLTRIQSVLVELAEKCEQEGTSEECPILKSLEEADD